MTKKLLFLSLIIVNLFAFCINASAETLSGECGEHITWTIDTSTQVAALTGSGATDDYDTSTGTGNVSPFTRYAGYVKKVIIGEGITAIGDEVFALCEKLEEVSLPGTLRSIGRGAFLICHALKAITLPDALEAIGESAFSDCSSLCELTVPASVTTLGSHIFSHCTNLTDIVFEDGCTVVGACMFQRCYAVSSVTLPNSITEIRERAFDYCETLESITLPTNLTTIESGVFSNCSALRAVTIPVSVATVKQQAFDGCYALNDVYYSGSNRDWFEIFFYDHNAALTAATLHQVSIIDAAYPIIVTTATESGYFTIHIRADIAMPDCVTAVSQYESSGKMKALSFRPLTVCAYDLSVPMAEGERILITFVSKAAMKPVCSAMSKVIAR